MAHFAVFYSFTVSCFVSRRVLKSTPSLANILALSLLCLRSNVVSALISVISDTSLSPTDHGLNWFLEQGDGTWASSIQSMYWPSTAVLPGMVHPQSKIYVIKLGLQIVFFILMMCLAETACHLSTVYCLYGPEFVKWCYMHATIRHVRAYNCVHTDIFTQPIVGDIKCSCLSSRQFSCHYIQ